MPLFCATVAMWRASSLLPIFWTSTSPRPPSSSIMMQPSVGFSMVFMQFRRVVFPQPFWPRMPTMLPLSILKVSPRRTSLDP